MTVPSELIIDIREEFELLEMRIIPTTNQYEIVNIPSRHIFANIDWINRETEKRPVWIICASGRRSQAIKDQYFPKNDGIKSSVYGIKLLTNEIKEDQTENKETHINASAVRIEKGQGGYGIQQYMQFAFAGMLSIILALIYFKVDKLIVIFVITGFIIMVLGQVFTKSCLLGKIVPKSVFVPENDNHVIKTD
jgi:hypothetical protein